MKRAFAPRDVLAAALLVGALTTACAHTASPKDMERARLAYELGVVELSNSRPQSALKEFQDAVDYDPALAKAHHALGLVFHKSYGRMEQAEKSFKKAIELEPNYSEAWNNLGVLFSEQGRFDEAEAAFKQALNDPHYNTPYLAQSNLGWVYHLNGRTAEGKQLIRNAVLINRGYCLGHKLLARILESEGHFDEAGRSWERFDQYCPEQPEALLRAAQRYLSEGDAAKAWRAVLDCVDKEPHPAALECRELLRVLPPMPAEVTPELPPDAAGGTVRGSRDLSESR